MTKFLYANNIAPMPATPRAYLTSPDIIESNYTSRKVKIITSTCSALCSGTNPRRITRHYDNWPYV